MAWIDGPYLAASVAAFFAASAASPTFLAAASAALPASLAALSASAFTASAAAATGFFSSSFCQPVMATEAAATSATMRIFFIVWNLSVSCCVSFRLFGGTRPILYHYFGDCQRRAGTNRPRGRFRERPIILRGHWHKPLCGIMSSNQGVQSV